MEVPDKIYLSQEKDEDGHVFIDYMWHVHQFKNMENIEYVRKDSFIKKAIEFIQKHTSEIYSDYQMDKEDWIKDFKKYI